ncbi:MAG: ATP-binding cassette domain-containing protein [Acidobacteria bacterium]|nr:MAG: ATP-binding cassette domain-containing protein [Acidobacteriota bacterium]
MPLVSLERVSIAYGHLPLLEDATLRLDPGERVCVIGRNGTGKSTLLKILAGTLPPDRGVARREPGVRTAMLVQDVLLSSDRPVFDVVAQGVGELSELVALYHHTAVQVAVDPEPALLDTLGRLQQTLEARDGWRLEQRIERVVERLQLPSETVVDTLSGGWRRRVLLARALVAQPEVLLLDEPTNHLDIDAIGWLETFLIDYPGAVVVVTHDRVFLQRVATRIVELDRGRLTSWPGDYANYQRRQAERLADEAVREAKQDTRLAVEEAWLRRGVKARRTRNEGRVKALLAMRAERANRRTRVGSVRLQAERAAPSGRVVFEATGVSKSFDGDPVIRDFTTRVLRGDRVGLIGPNGAGKTTLLRLFLGELQPDQGDIRRGTNVVVGYYDQQREQLDPERTVFDTVGDGNDTVTVNGERRHVHGYLRDFLFSPDRARSPVKALSGGERNRLLLARLLTRPANVLVLDEPTNDLDLETLELLEALLVDWPGTLLLVSHDRTFLDNIVSSTLVFEGGGRVREYVGGYEDWLRQRPAAAAGERSGRRRSGRGAAGATEAALAAVPVTETPRLSYHEQRELAALPQRIEGLEDDAGQLNETVAGPHFYRESADTIKTTLARQEQLQAELAQSYARWETLEARRGSFRG